MKHPTRLAFTLVELLTLIAIIGILAAILVPVLELFRNATARTVDSNNVRQITQASLIFADKNSGEFPMAGRAQGRFINQNGEVETGTNHTPNIWAIATALARTGELNDGSVWVSSRDNVIGPQAFRNLGMIWNEDTSQVDTDFRNSAISFSYVAGLRTSLPSSTPIVFTRGLHTNGTWLTNSLAVYGNEGGHIAFIGGHVRFYEHLGPNADQGELVRRDGERTNNIRATFSDAHYSYSSNNTPTASPAGMPGHGF